MDHGTWQQCTLTTLHVEQWSLPILFLIWEGACLLLRTEPYTFLVTCGVPDRSIFLRLTRWCLRKSCVWSTVGMSRISPVCVCVCVCVRACVRTRRGGEGILRQWRMLTDNQICLGLPSKLGPSYNPSPEATLSKTRTVYPRTYSGN